MPTSTSDGGTSNGVVGTTISHDANGVVGHNSDVTARNAIRPSGHGVFGGTQVPDGAGVFGAHASFGVGTAGVGLIGVYGASDNGFGVLGVSAPQGAKGGDGVKGVTNNEIRNGIYGLNNATSPRGNDDPAGNGVFGFTLVPNGAGVLGVSGVGGTGVQGSSSGHGVVGNGRFGVTGTGSIAGVWGIGEGTGWAGLFNGSISVSDTGYFDTQTETAAIYAKGKTAGYFDGNVVVTGDIIFTNAADCAEEFDVAEAGLDDPGTVMVLGADARLEACTRAYDKRVIGVISGAVDFRPGIVLDKRPDVPGRRPIALVGKVFCKVDADHGKIEAGDLLTTSPTDGHAMRADYGSAAFGAVIGKALEPFENGRGLIPILVVRQ